MLLLDTLRPPPPWRRYATVLNANQDTNKPVGYSATVDYVARAEATLSIPECSPGSTGPGLFPGFPPATDSATNNGSEYRCGATEAWRHRPLGAQSSSMPRALWAQPL